MGPLRDGEHRVEDRHRRNALGFRDGGRVRSAGAIAMPSCSAQDLTTFVVISVAYGFAKRCKSPFDMNQALSRYASHRTAQGLSPSVEATLKACLRLLEAAYYRNEHKAPKRATCTPFDLEVYTRTKARLEAGDYPAK